MNSEVVPPGPVKASLMPAEATTGRMHTTATSGEPSLQCVYFMVNPLLMDTTACAVASDCAAGHFAGPASPRASWAKVWPRTR